MKRSDKPVFTEDRTALRVILVEEKYADRIPISARARAVVPGGFLMKPGVVLDERLWEDAAGGESYAFHVRPPGGEECRDFYVPCHLVKKIAHCREAGG